MGPKKQILGAAASVWGALPLPLRRSFLHATNPSFLVGAVALIRDESDRVLLLEHRFRTPYAWGLPGGFIRHGETLDAALARELDEELGLAIEVEAGAPFDVELNVPGRYVSVTLLARARSTDFSIRSPEILAHEFIEKGHLPAGTYPHQARVVERWWAR